MTAKSIPQPPMPPRVRKSKDYQYRVLERDGKFIAQQCLGWIFGWRNIVYRGPVGGLSLPLPGVDFEFQPCYGTYEFDYLEHAKALIDHYMKPKHVTIEKIHYL